MRRRDFIGLVGSAVVWPLEALAQQGERKLRVGVLKGGAGDDASADVQLVAFTKALAALGWNEGRNIQIDIRWIGIDDAQQQNLNRFAAELAALKPDVILAHTSQVVAALQRLTRTIPIVFVSVSDPVRSGFVNSVARPGGNITGLANYEASLPGKLVDLLKQVVPDIVHLRTMIHGSATGVYRESMEAAARSHAISLGDAPIETEADIEPAFAALGKIPNSGLIVLPDPFLGDPPRRGLIVSLANRYRVPTVYPFRFFVEAGGLMSYGNDLIEQFRQASSYVDRILRGAAPADLPVQLPTKYELAINLKAAKALDLVFPSSLLVGADHVIE